MGAKNTKNIHELSFRKKLTCLSPSETQSLQFMASDSTPLSAVKPQICTGTERKANQNRICSPSLKQRG